MRNNETLEIYKLPRELFKTAETKLWVYEKC